MAGVPVAVRPLRAPALMSSWGPRQMAATRRSSSMKVRAMSTASSRSRSRSGDWPPGMMSRSYSAGFSSGIGMSGSTR